MKDALNRADILMFHAPNHQKIASNALRHRNKQAVFAMISMEQPLYAPTLRDTQYLNSNFDLMVTYSFASYFPGTKVPNLPITYYPSHILPTDTVLKPPRPVHEKTGYDTGK